MTRRKIIAASLFFTMFGALALMPPLVLLARFDRLVLGVPVETVYVFVLWLAMVVGARWFGRVLPDDRPPPGRQRDGLP
jgi:membrane protein implicated in regulation of membrane protease activity